MRNCSRCGGRLRRIHRTFWERFSYLAIYECRDCHDITSHPRHYRYHLGEHCRCPRCGTLRVTRLKERDHIDPLNTGLLHLLERLAGGRLYHCRFCRVQFYDRRSLASPPPRTEEVGEERKSAAKVK
ncbi:MAG: hypothetical protein LAQ30_16385 [Acidobacteriia bacterium]|nr:hypothetical protein [Terriglobia bacterium]